MHAPSNPHIFLGAHEFLIVSVVQVSVEVRELVARCGMDIRGDLQREVRDAIVAITLGAERRLSREEPARLLAGWLEAPPEPGPGLALVARSLEDVHGRAGSWLAWGVEQGQLGTLVSVGALAGIDGETTDTRGIPQLQDPEDWRHLQRLCEQALGILASRAPERLSEILREAEGRYFSLRPSFEEAIKVQGLRASLDAGLHQALEAAADGHPLEVEAVGALERNIHASRAAGALELARDATRLAHFVTAMETLPDTLTLLEWRELAWRHVAWADMVLRTVRRRVEEVDANLAAAARKVIARVLEIRHRLNLRFATQLSQEWNQAVANKDLRRPLPIHQVTRVLVRRLLDEERRVLLVVLDGCDLSTFLELCHELDDTLGFQLPPVDNPVFRADLAALQQVPVGLSLLPTVTSHARRGLFAGDVPGHTVLAEEEAASANASGDLQAWQGRATTRWRDSRKRSHSC